MTTGEYNMKKTPLVVAMMLAMSGGHVHSAPGDAAGIEFPVNEYVTGNQIVPAAGMDADGDFVIVWQSQGPDGDGDGVYAHRYDADGSPAGNEFRVNSYTTSDQRAPDISLDADGDFVITWSSVGQDGDSDGIYAQRYDADGSPAGDEFHVSSFTVGAQELPRIAMDADGDFVIVWQSEDQDGDSAGIYARRYHADGSPADGEFRVNMTTSGRQEYPSIALDANGDFVIVWTSDGQDGSGTGIYARRYDADGSPASNEFMVNTFTVGSQYQASIAMDADGDFLVAWTSQGPDGDGDGIFAQRFNSEGGRVGSEFQVNTFTTGGQSNSDVAMDADGDFVIAWTSYYQDSSLVDIYAQRFTATGVATGSEFRVNSYLTSAQDQASIASDADGDFIITWESQDQDTSANGIFAQRYEGAGNFAAGTVDLALVVQDDTDPVRVNNDFIYTLVTTNNGNGIALDVNIDEPIPGGLSYVSDDSASAGWDCALVADTFACNRGLMKPAEVSTVNVTVTATAAGTQSNTVTVSSALADANETDNTDTETTEVTPLPASDGSSGLFSFGLLSMLLALPMWLCRRLNYKQLIR